MDEETSPEDDQDKPSNPFSGLSGDIKDRIEEERIATQEGERQVALDSVSYTHLTLPTMWYV